MSKAHRGAGIRAEYANAGRGNCPICKRTAIKVVYEQEINEKTYKICKQCKAGLANGKLKEAVAAL